MQDNSYKQQINERQLKCINRGSMIDNLYNIQINKSFEKASTISHVVATLRSGCQSLRVSVVTHEGRPSTPLCQYLSETLKAVGHFYLVSMPGELKDPKQGVTV